MSYCDMANALPADTDNPNKHYHDCCYGVEIRDDNALFERLALEINQAGLSWTLMLKKQAAFQAAFAQFDVARVAAFNDADKERLLNDAGIVRNRLKIDAVLHNARQIMALQATFGSFQAWLWAHHPATLDEWVRHFKREFKFMGPEIVKEFLMSTGYLPGAHDEHCPVYAQIARAQPPWLRHSSEPLRPMRLPESR